MSKQAKIGILLSAVWLIAVSMVEINEIRRGDPGYGVDLFLIDYIAFGIFPLLVSWGFWWNRKV